MEGQIDDLAMGPLHTRLETGQFILMNVHYGNVAPQTSRFRGMCVFLDVSDDAAFESLAHGPLALVASVREPARVTRAFEHVIERCSATAWSPKQYQGSPRIVQRMAREMASAVSATGHEGVIATQMLLKAALLELLGTLMQQVTLTRGSAVSASLPAGLGKAIALMHRDYHKPGLGRAHLAKAAALHPDHFTRQFKEHLRVSPMQYLAQLRISQAMFLLTHTHQRIGQIAHQVGFEDALHFSRVFRQHAKQSPKAFREKTQR